MKTRNKVAIVTGAAGMIGYGICKVLNASGMNVVLADMNFDQCESLAGTLESKNGCALPVQVDVTNKSSLLKMVDVVMERFGRIDVLINNAGVIELGSLIEMSENGWDRVVNVNLKGVFLCTQSVAPVMIKQGSGSIVNISSVAAKRPAPLQSAYAATKHGVFGLTQVWCQELAPHNITVNTVCPGFVESPMWSKQLGPAYSSMVGVASDEVMSVLAKTQMPLGRPQTPEDIGNAVEFICRSENMTGQSIFIDGGFTRC